MTIPTNGTYVGPIDFDVRAIFPHWRAAGDWEYSVANHKYRNTKTGRFMSPTTQIKLRDAVTSHSKEKLLGTTGKLLDGDISITEWRKQFSRQMQSTYTQQFAFGRGGVNQMTDADRRELAEIIDKQNRYLTGFTEQIRDGDLSFEQIEARSAMYADGATGAYETGLLASFGDDRPPQVPGDGTTICLSNCKCFLEITRDDEGLAVYWRLEDSASHCEDCEDLAADWDPWRPD